MKPQTLIFELDSYMKTQSFIMMLIGIYMFFVFSRLFVTTSFWKPIIWGDIVFVKQVVQEGLEALGYTFCLILAIIFKKDDLDKISYID